MKIHYKNHLRKHAQDLRKAGNLSEVLLWRELKADKLGARFVRQRAVGNYIVDFYCYSLRLAIEIDGGTHDGKLEQDMKRQKELESMGVRFLRFMDKEVRYNLAGVIAQIEEFMRRENKSLGSSE